MRYEARTRPRLLFWTAAALAVLLLSGGRAAQAGAYPPPGSPDPGAPCARPDIAQSTRFFCDFMTLERWLAAGRPDFVDASGKRWQPWFYGKDGLSNQLLIEGKAYRPAREGWLEALFDVEDFEAEDYSYFWDLFRYTPWSVQFRYAYQCGERQMVNPPALRGQRIRREHLLTFGWEQAGADTADPTTGFDRGAMLVLETLANLEFAVDAAQRERLGEGHTVRDEINAMAEGRGAFWPDFDRDAEVWLLRPGDDPRRLDDLDRAAERLAQTGLLVTNDAISTWQDGYAHAVKVAHERGPLLYIYFAQDAFSPLAGNRVYRQRLRYLIGRAAQDAPVTVVSRGRSAGIVADVVAGQDGILHEAVAPVPGPWGRREYAAAVERSAGRTRLEVPDNDLVARLGAGAEYPAQPPDCLELQDG